jgi:hypothetical protein
MSPTRRKCALAGMVVMLCCYVVLAVLALPVGYSEAAWQLVEIAIVLTMAAVVASLVLGIIGFRYVAGWVAIVGSVFWPLAYYCLRLI